MTSKSYMPTYIFGSTIVSLEKYGILFWQDPLCRYRVSNHMVWLYEWCCSSWAPGSYRSAVRPSTSTSLHAGPLGAKDPTKTSCEGQCLKNSSEMDCYNRNSYCFCFGCQKTVSEVFNYICQLKKFYKNCAWTKRCLRLFSSKICAIISFQFVKYSQFYYVYTTIGRQYDMLILLILYYKFDHLHKFIIIALINFTVYNDSFSDSFMLKSTPSGSLIWIFCLFLCPPTSSSKLRVHIILGVSVCPCLHVSVLLHIVKNG